MGLARVIELGCLDYRNWLPALSEDSQARVLGYWELAKLRDVDTGPLSACTLTELFKIAAFDEYVRAALQFTSKSKFNNCVDGLPQMRNKVMHPVRPMVLSKSDVAEIRRKLDVFDQLNGRIQSVLAAGDTPLSLRS